MSSRFSEWQMVHTRAWRSGSMGWGLRWRVSWVVLFSFIVTMWITCGDVWGNGTDCGISRALESKRPSKAAAGGRAAVDLNDRVVGVNAILRPSTTSHLINSSYGGSECPQGLKPSIVEAL